MQGAKMKNMIELCKLLSTRKCDAIYKNEFFECLRELKESCSQWM